MSTGTVNRDFSKYNTLGVSIKYRDTTRRGGI